jgi:hypothetical protein
VFRTDYEPGGKGLLISAVKDVVANGGNPLKLPTRRNPTSVEEQCFANAAVPFVVTRDMGNCDSFAPPLASPRDRGEAPTANEGKLAGLEDHPANRGRKTAGLGAVENDFGNSQLAGKWLALRFEIHSTCKAFTLPDSGVAE